MDRPYAFLFIILFAISTTTQAAPPDDEKNNARPALTAQRTRAAITIDGYLDEADWLSAPAATDFRQYEPEEGALSQQRTEVRVLYSNNDVYIGAFLYDDSPGEIVRTLGRRDDQIQADWFLASIDSYYGRKTAYTFGVNAAGIQIDGMQIDNGNFRNDPLEFDTSWDAVWASAVRMHENGWSVEMRIPYSMLRFSEAESQIWGINFRRVIPRISEMSEWALVRRADYSSGVVANYGTLQGLKNIKPRRNIQISPYTISGLRRTESEEIPGQSIGAGTVDFGGDIKIGITSNITLDATINPDFGQVESDPAVLNLTVFETFLEERRPFFVEGVQIFDYTFGRRDGLLYTRRIGANNTPIIGATKLSGRTNNGLSFGVLGAMTGHHFDPTRLYGVGRVIQQIGNYSNVGGIVTAFDTTDPEDDRIRSYTSGVDWDLRFDQNRYKFDGQFSLSHRFNPLDQAAQETGVQGSLGVDKTRGIWTYGAGLEFMSDIFNPRDLGVLRSNDQFRMTAFVSQILNNGEPFGPIQRGSIRLFHWSEWSFDRSLYTGSGFFMFSDWLTRGFQRASLTVVNRDLFGGYDQFETRGLYPRKSPYSIEIRSSFLSDARRSWQFGPVLESEQAPGEGGQISAGFEGVWNVGTRLSLESEVAFGVENGRLAWASNEVFRKDAAGWMIGSESGIAPEELSPEAYVAFDDVQSLDAIMADVLPYEGMEAYYVPIFGKRDNRSVDISLRGNVTFTRNLSLQIFSQLFVARGTYDQFRVLQNPDSFADFSSYPKQHDFSLNSFLVNTVLRWEFRPGSSLYLVWSQSRSSDVTIDPFNPNNVDLYNKRSLRQMGDIFGLFPSNAFLIKLNYLIRS